MFNDEALINFRTISWMQVTHAVDHVQLGTDALRTAKRLQRRSRKCMMIAIILLLVIAIIIVLAVAIERADTEAVVGPGALRTVESKAAIG
ncbi:hypothetical protein CISIN_1g043394mg [Citrus sinensis]|uniref:t-SNARE coiled-coil homology domain-containing protein n=1 Tax=Citrus sinensis TaxID=2711 RepID=A0A067F8M0_CITSI|nr:hypothetical protein CISIN_1g043394mg [Citrus sinensis]